MPEAQERNLIARMGAHASWAATEDRSARTAPARRAMLDRFERQVDPNGLLTATERARRAESARRAYFSGLALKSVQSRRKAAEARKAIPELERAAAEADAELAAGGAV